MFLGLDLGTTKIKAVLVNGDGEIAASGSAPINIWHSGEDGVEQDIDDIFSAVVTSLQAVAAQADVSGVKSIGISSQGGALQILDGTNAPVGRIISWLDGRGKPLGDTFTQEIGPKKLAALTGHASSKMALGQLLRLSAESPQVLQHPNRIGFVGDIVVSRLCGRRAHDATSLSCAVLYNPTLRTTDPEIISRLKLDESQLPDLLSATESAGGMLERVAVETSLPVGIPVSSAVHDQYASALSVGAINPGDVMVGTGTAWVLLVAADHFVEPIIDDAFVCTHLVPDTYGQILSAGNGGSALDWAITTFGMEGLSGDELETRLQKSPAGSDGVMFRPLLSAAGGANLKPDTRGAFTGLRLFHTRENLLRAVVEGLALELNRYLEFLLHAQVPITRLIMCGGAAGGDVTPQIISDVTGLPVKCVTETSTSALGAAVLARALIEPHLPLCEISRQMAPPKRTFEPGENSRVYRNMYQQYSDSLRDIRHGGNQ